MDTSRSWKAFVRVAVNCLTISVFNKKNVNGLLQY